MKIHFVDGIQARNFDALSAIPGGDTHWQHDDLCGTYSLLASSAAKVTKLLENTHSDRAVDREPVFICPTCHESFNDTTPLNLDGADHCYGCTSAEFGDSLPIVDVQGCGHMEAES